MLFKTTNVNKAEWLSLIFENRNQSYGAYVLRKESGSYLLKALLLVVFLLFSAIIFSSFSWVKEEVVNVPKPINPDSLYVVTPVELIEKPKVEKPKGAEKQPQTQEPQDLKTINYSGDIKPSNDIKAIDLPDLKSIETSIISNVDQSGTEASAGLNASTSDNKGKGNGTGEGVKDGNDLNYAGTVEIMPEFVGGMDAWAKFLGKNLRYPIQARDEGIQGRVTVSFVVEKNGELSNVKVLRGIGYGCDEEAIRVIKKSPFWKPGFQNGRPVRVSYVMPIVFRLDY
jgi:protein TonB